MKKPNLIGIMALLFFLAVSAACVQAPNTPVPAKNTTEIHYTTYGGFVMPAYAVQQLVVTPHKARFTVMSREGNVTEMYEKNLTNEQFAAIVNVFADNNFSSYGDRYDGGQNHISDVGWADISLIDGTRNKTVTTYNTNNYLPDGLIRIREKLQETAAWTRTPDESQLRLALTYQPMQCEQTVWEKWEAASGRRYIRAPTEEEILRHYYSASYGIEVANYTWVSNGGVTCQACGVCPLMHHFEVTVNASEMQPMLDEGWRRE